MLSAYLVHGGLTKHNA